MSSSEINESSNFTFINKLTNEFYKFVGEIYIEYNKKQLESINSIDSQVEKIEQMEIDNTKTDETIETKDETIINKKQTFIEYLLFKLYYNYGVKRRMVNEHIALLYYSKNLYKIFAY